MREIPTSFRLANRRWRVAFKEAPVSYDGHQVYGYADFENARIVLDKGLLAKGKEEHLMHTWEHELMHALLGTHGMRDHDETFVDGMSALRRQYEQTKAMPRPDKNTAPSRRRKSRG